jgi:hypothetical protein
MTDFSDVAKRANLFSNKTGFLYGTVQEIAPSEYRLEISLEEAVIENREALEELTEGMDNPSFDYPYYILSVEGEASFHVDFMNRRILNQGTLIVDLKKRVSNG